MSERDVDQQPAREAFLTRWSQRKLARKPDADAPATVSPPATDAADPPAAPVPASELPPIDGLDESSDYSRFLAPGVAEELQRLALRKLFGAIEFNFRDGLDDYADDYRCFEALGNTVTADMRHRLEREFRSQLASTQPQHAETAPESADTPAPTMAVNDDDSPDAPPHPA